MEGGDEPIAIVQAGVDDVDRHGDSRLLIAGVIFPPRPSVVFVVFSPDEVRIIDVSHDLLQQARLAHAAGGTNQQQAEIRPGVGQRLPDLLQLIVLTDKSAGSRGAGVGGRWWGHESLFIGSNNRKGSKVVQRASRCAIRPTKVGSMV